MGLKEDINNMEHLNMPSTVLEKYDSLPPRIQNNARAFFLNDWEWCKGNPTKESIFADKWGLDYESKFAVAEHRKEMTHVEAVEFASREEDFNSDIF